MEKSKSSTAVHDEPTKGEAADEIKQVTSALHGDLTKLAGKTADKVISHWQTKLQGMEGASFKSIADELGKLRTLVDAKSPDGAKISKALTGLGSKVEKAAEEQGGVIAAALKPLSHALTKGGQSLADSEE